MSLWGLITGLGHGLVSGGLGAGEDGDAPPVVEDRPGTIRLPGRVVPLCQIRLPSTVVPLCRLRIIHVSNRLHIGDTGHVATVECYNSAGALDDPTTLTLVVRAPSGLEFELEYGVAPEVEGGDAVIRTAEGMYDVHLDFTEERGAGTWYYGVVTTGDVKAAERGSAFRVDTLLP